MLRGVYLRPSTVDKVLGKAHNWSAEQRYNLLLSEADRVLRVLVEEVDAIKGRAKPIVIVSGDHGESFGEQGRYFHDSVFYDSGLHVPFVLRAPGIVAPGSFDGGSHSLADLTPTVLDLVGIPYHADRLDGQSLLRPASRDKKNYFACWFEGLCVGYVQNKTKVVYMPLLDSWLVYDLEKDPKEFHPSIDSPAWRKQADEVALWYEEHLYDDEGLTWPAVSLFGGRWTCAEGMDHCVYSGPTECPGSPVEVE